MVLLVDLRGDISDAIGEKLPRTDDMDKFYDSPEFQDLLNDVMEVIKINLKNIFSTLLGLE